MVTFAGKMFKQGWGLLNKLELIKKVSILRYEVVTEGRPQVGIDAVTKLVEGLADLDAYVSPVSTKEVIASQGKIELTDMLFVFMGTEVFETDALLYDGKTYDIVMFRYFDRDSGIYVPVGRAT